MNNKTLSVEELLKPRYKVIADYPGSVLSIGAIVAGETIGILHPEPLSKFPAIFRPLQWWEERSKGEMPRYVKMIQGGEVRIAERWDIDKQGKGVACLSRGYWLYDRGFTFTPATESEYLSYTQNTPNNGTK